MNTKSKRQLAREKNQKRKFISRLAWGGIGIILLVLLGFILSKQGSPAAGETVPVMSDIDHIETGSDPGEYNSNPPTSGLHYAEELQAGFYETNDHPFPAGYLVHNLEHGYVIFWYNCDLIDAAACTALKDGIKSVMEEFQNFKTIAYPWPSLDVPFAMTSWGRIQKFELFNEAQAAAFYRANLNQAPEPNAP